MDNKELLNIAKQAMENAYAPYSEFCVGAAVITEDGTVFAGCNVENSSYGAAICAERTAIVKGVSEGYKHFTKIAIVSSDEKYTFPCGICRQVLSEFMSDGVVVLEDKTEGIKEWSVSELIPNAFFLE